MAALEARRQERQRRAAEQHAVLTAEVEPLCAELMQAREDKDWPRADAIRARLAQRSITVQITKHGITWYR